MPQQRIQQYILICYFIKLHSTQEQIFPQGHQQKLGSHQAPQGNIEELWKMPSSNVFYDNYVVKSKPMIFRNAAKHTDAFKLWTDDYLSEKFGDVEVNVDYGKKENRERPADVMKLREFLKIYNKADRYLVDSLPDLLQHEFQLPQCILCGGFTKRLTDSVLWFSSGGTKSFLHVDNVENINCLISGQKDWFFIDKENSKKIELDHGEGDYCGVDVDKVDMIKYPSLQSIPWWSAQMHAGDCMYVPYGWAHQVRSYSRNIAVNIWWAVMKSFNHSDCQQVSEKNDKRKSLSEFEFTHGEQIRFLILSLLEEYGGKLSYDIMHKMILHEHNGRHLVNEESFALLDQNKDDILVVEEIENLDPEIIEIALQRTPPGEINIRGRAQSIDPKLQAILNRLGRLEPYIEEFLVRVHKTKDDIRKFLETYSEKLHTDIQEYLQQILNEHDVPTKQVRQDL